MKIFLTGGTGFIGSHFVQQALDAGHEVRALRRVPTSRPRIPLDREPLWIDADMRQVPRSALESCDCLVHLAAHTPNVPYDTLENCIHWNVLAPLKLFRDAMKSGIGRFIVAGSCFEYGRSADLYDFIPPEAPLLATQSYPASKAAASICFHQLAVEHGLQLSILRIFQVFGKGEAETRFWPSLVRAATSGQDFSMSEGLQIRDFIPVEVVARRVLQDACTPDPNLKLSPRITNLGLGIPQSLRQFAEQWWASLNAKGTLQIGKIPMRPNEMMRCVAKV